MRTQRFDRDRRTFLETMISLAVAGGAGLFTLARSARAMGSTPISQGMREVAGTVKVNGEIAAVGTAVGPDAVVLTGPRSKAVFVVGDNAFLMGELSHLELGGTAGGQPGLKLVTKLRLTAGRLLSVFGVGRKELITPTAVCGVRGTGIYAEVQPDRTYVCTCYGEVELQATASDAARETVRTSHHEAPRFIYGRGERLIEKAGMFNHTDGELIMLESLVQRRPPFSPTPVSGRGSAY